MWHHIRTSVRTLCYVLLSLAPSARAADRTLNVPATQPWTDTGLDLHAGERIQISATGEVTVSSRKLTALTEYWSARSAYDSRVGPRGTYRFEPLDLLRGKYRLALKPGAGAPTASVFPLPAAYWGPWPAYGLIGRIGREGRPFYVGGQLDLTAPAAGRLELGINDFDCSDNQGAWAVRLAGGAPASAAADPVRDRVHLAAGAAAAKGAAAAPLAGARSRLIVLYIDGLRLDVLNEMARGGFLPQISEIFYRQGTQVDPAFTIYPSSTIPANAVMWTGLFSDRNGIKDQVVLQRRAAGLPQEIDRLTEFSPEINYALIHRQGAKPLFDYFANHCYTTILPINWFSPPHQWVAEAANVSPALLTASVGVKRNIDEANFKHALTFVHNADARLMILWLPAVDEAGHRTPYGQFGAARRTLVQADAMIGQLRDELRLDRSLEDTVFVLCADHGHMGGEPLADGRPRLNQIWDPATEFFLRQGFNVHHLSHTWTLPGVPSERFAYLADGGGGTGYLGLFLPFGGRDSGDWSRRNALRELLAYRCDPAQEALDLPATLMRQHADPARYRTDLAGDRPIAMVLAKIDEANYLIYKSRECQALVTLRRGATARQNEVRYLPVRNYRFNALANKYDYDENAAEDPLGYRTDAGLAPGGSGIEAFFGAFHGEEQWLAATARTRYPDAPVLMGHHLFNAPTLAPEVRSGDPDLVLVPNPGWFFVEHPMDYGPLESGSQHFGGTSHGYPDADAMRVPLFFSGHGIRKGAVLDAPHTLADLTPTLLWLFGKPVESYGLDGRPITEILEGRP